ncbi:MAG TPA: peptidylprolyl isomerase [Bacteroidales bacterium]|jgi:FKBP-type peptidyl-prolyl cis-trans isomerase|nr:peptidylprolyl isomerase [Bacteroidales bacterium]
MKNILKIFAASAVLIGVFSCSSNMGSKAKLDTKMDTISYMIGVSIGSNFETMPAKDELDLALIRKGMHDIMNGDTVFTTQELQVALNDFGREQQQLAAEEQIRPGKEYLEENKEKEGVMVTESGLQYRVIKEGNGVKPAVTDTVVAHYTGTLIDGTVFDSSKDLGEPARFALNRVIRGWTEGLQLMSVGSVYEFVIPHELAYGPRGSRSIKPYQTLIFEVELIDIVKAE